MNCFPCFSSQKSKKSISENDLPVAQATGPPPPPPAHDASSPPPVNNIQKPSVETRNENNEANTAESKNGAAKTFTFRELAAATKNFKQECLLGEGGCGRVYKGTLQSGKVVAVKQLDRNGMQGNKEFLVEVLVLSLLHHPNLVHLVGYCADGDQRLLVYEYMPMGSLEDHLLDISEDKKPLDWLARMKLASGAAQGLEYLHEKANPPVTYRDLRSSNIFLDEEFNPRLSDYGLAKLGLGGSKMHVSYGYCAPEYERTGELTLKSDVYSFGVVLLELISGRRAIDTTRPTAEQNLVSWAQPIFRDPKRFPEMADPLLKGQFPVRSLNQVVGVAAMCLQEESSVRPLISDVVAALGFLTVAQDEAVPSPLPSPNHQPSSEPQNQGEEVDDDHDDRDSSESSDNDHHGGDNSEKPQGQVKKSVKWASKCRSKVKSPEGSFGSSSSHNSNTETRDGSCGGENSSSLSKVESQDGSVGSSSSDDSDDGESERGQNSRSNSNGGFGSNSRQDSNAGSWQDENSNVVASHEEDEGSFRSNSSGGGGGRNSRSDSNASVGSNSDSNVES